MNPSRTRTRADVSNARHKNRVRYSYSTYFPIRGILIQAEAETILKMSETLESANFTRDQSDAFIESMALAMNTFAVTPEILDARLAEQKKTVAELKGTTNELKNSMQELHRSVLFYFRGFMLVTFAGLLGILGVVLAT